MADTSKDTIYIDIDDEITGIIDKLKGSSGKVVALVLPKRATALQSIVNMKLLKRAADEGKKNLVLVTTESGLMPLAGAVGLHVAKTPNSRPEIPAGPEALSDQEEQVDELDFGDETPVTADTDRNQPIGALAGATMPLPAKPAAENGIETLELDNADPAPAAAVAVAAPKPKSKKDKKLAVPDFDRFRLLLIAGAALLLLLIIFGYFAVAVLPKATIAIKTNASNVNTDVDMTLSTTATNLNSKSNIVPAKQVKVEKTLTGTANATGQKNNGDKAVGTITMTVCASNAGATNPIPAGTGVSSGGKTYVTQEAASFQYVPGGCGNQFRFRASDVDIKAQTGGASFNVSNADFKVSGRPDITATGSASGGTDDIQTVISQADIDSAKGKINSTESTAQQELKDQLDGQGLFAIAATYSAGQPSVTASAIVGDAASTVTVTETITYTMLGVNEEHLKTLVDNDIKDQIDTAQQGILSRGITQAAFKLQEQTATGAKLNLQTVAEVGPSIDTDTIAANAAGKKKGEITADIKSNPDVTDVDVKLSPFWVTKAPKASKITVTVAKPTKTANAD